MRGLSTLPASRPDSIRFGRRPLRHLPGAIRRRSDCPIAYRSPVTPAAARRGSFGRWVRRVAGAMPPLTADQQLRLLQLALNVKLKREGKPADSIRLTLVEGGSADRGPALVRLERNRSVPSSGSLARAR